jgi:hypothetical protein
MEPAEGVGWQHGDIPEPPDGLMPASVEAWKTWFGAWFASNWLPDDLPVLRQVIRLYDDVERGGTKAADKSQLHVWMRSYGITPDGQIALRWARPKPKEIQPSPSQHRSKGDPYAHLRVVGEE